MEWNNHKRLHMSLGVNGRIRLLSMRSYAKYRLKEKQLLANKQGVNTMSSEAGTNLLRSTNP